MAVETTTPAEKWARRLEEVRARAPQLVDPQNEEAVLLGELIDSVIGLAEELACELAAEQARSEKLQARIAELERMAGEG